MQLLGCEQLSVHATERQAPGRGGAHEQGAEVGACGPSRAALARAAGHASAAKCVAYRARRVGAVDAEGARGNHDDERRGAGDGESGEVVAEGACGLRLQGGWDGVRGMGDRACSDGDRLAKAEAREVSVREQRGELERGPGQRTQRERCAEDGEDDALSDVGFHR